MGGEERPRLQPCSTLPPEVDPFPPSELRRLSKGATEPSPRWRVWIGWCPRGQTAHMGMGVRPFAVSSRDDDLNSPPPYNMANAFIAANGVVVLVHWLPPKMPTSSLTP